MNRPWYERELAGELKSTSDVDAVLAADGATIAVDGGITATR